ncbi:recombinase family protein [Novosphingobium sp. SG707]|uniref:recombinase family protein n=1 Tax=Novosphingobium sp. SG707 TaxID=2586996 RepID=UPI0017C720E1|nr:recombinase family protein [Novosphingobium sp. SG707]NKJ00338.1 DNA invertase Pin-like site-specific DNA recombinase [Novosphingobium sp. SG707]
MTFEKISPQHLERKAILYVRQSSAHQVLHNRESRALQYAMRDRLVTLGWSHIETIDEDLGRSAAGGVTRIGFDRMVAEVCLGKVGAVAAREVSRFARNSRDWQQLIEMCRVVDTVLVDQEAVYAPRQGNDRLLLGLKGDHTNRRSSTTETTSIHPLPPDPGWPPRIGHLMMPQQAEMS